MRHRAILAAVIQALTSRPIQHPTLNPPEMTLTLCSHIRQLAESHNVPMPVIDVAHQHMLSARAHGGDEMDWTALVGGQRISAGLQPFKGRVSLTRPRRSRGRGEAAVEAKPRSRRSRGRKLHYHSCDRLANEEGGADDPV
jgi:hypothetical protein